MEVRVMWQLLIFLLCLNVSQGRRLIENPLDHGKQVANASSYVLVYIQWTPQRHGTILSGYSGTGNSTTIYTLQYNKRGQLLARLGQQCRVAAVAPPRDHAADLLLSYTGTKLALKVGRLTRTAECPAMKLLAPFVHQARTKCKVFFRDLLTNETGGQEPASHEVLFAGDDMATLPCHECAMGKWRIEVDFLPVAYRDGTLVTLSGRRDTVYVEAKQGALRLCRIRGPKARCVKVENLVPKEWVTFQIRANSTQLELLVNQSSSGHLALTRPLKLAPEVHVGKPPKTSYPQQQGLIGYVGKVWTDNKTRSMSDFVVKGDGDVHASIYEYGTVRVEHIVGQRRLQCNGLGDHPSSGIGQRMWLEGSGEVLPAQNTALLTLTPKPNHLYWCTQEGVKHPLTLFVIDDLKHWEELYHQQVASSVVTNQSSQYSSGVWPPILAHSGVSPLLQDEQSYRDRERKYLAFVWGIALLLLLLLLLPFCLVCCWRDEERKEARGNTTRKLVNEKKNEQQATGLPGLVGKGRDERTRESKHEKMQPQRSYDTKARNEKIREKQSKTYDQKKRHEVVVEKKPGKDRNQIENQTKPSNKKKQKLDNDREKGTDGNHTNEFGQITVEEKYKKYEIYRNDHQVTKVKPLQNEGPPSSPPFEPPDVRAAAPSESDDYILHHHQHPSQSVIHVHKHQAVLRQQAPHTMPALSNNSGDRGVLELVSETRDPQPRKEMYESSDLHREKSYPIGYYQLQEKQQELARESNNKLRKQHQQDPKAVFYQDQVLAKVQSPLPRQAVKWNQSINEPEQRRRQHMIGRLKKPVFPLESSNASTQSQSSTSVLSPFSSSLEVHRNNQKDENVRKLPNSLSSQRDLKLVMLLLKAPSPLRDMKAGGRRLGEGLQRAVKTWSEAGTSEEPQDRSRFWGQSNEGSEQPEWKHTRRGDQEEGRNERKQCHRLRGYQESRSQEQQYTKRGGKQGINEVQEVKNSWRGDQEWTAARDGGHQKGVGGGQNYDQRKRSDAEERPLEYSEEIPQELHIHLQGGDQDGQDTLWDAQEIEGDEERTSSRKLKMLEITAGRPKKRQPHWR